MNRFFCGIVLALALALSVGAQAPTAQPKKTGASTAPASVAKTLEAKIRQGWQDFKAKNKTGFGAVLADDSTQIWADNKPSRDKASTLKDMDIFTIDTFTLSNVKVTPLGTDAALATYQAKVVGAMGGEKLDVTLAVTEVWVKRGGDWKYLRYHESEIK